MQDLAGDRPVTRIELYLDDATEPFRTIVPPLTVELDTRSLDDGPHVLRLQAYDALGNVGRRTIPFTVRNGPGITVTGLRSGEHVAGDLALEVNAFSGNQPFDPTQAESSGPIPVWTWVLIAIITAWATWYGLEYFVTPAAYATTPTYERNPVAQGNAPSTQSSPPAYSGKGVAAGFDYAAQGASVYTANCVACHGASGTGVPGAFPPLVHDPVVTAADPKAHINIVLHGLKGKAISGTAYSSQMPSFSQLSDADIAAVIDHERTSWGNQAPIVSPDEVKRARP
jgi:cytochrome c oxidase subunit II